MIHNVVCIKDEVVGRFFQPMYVPVEGGEAIKKRCFNEIINATTIIKENPADYNLYDIAIFDDENGFTAVEPKKLFSAAQVKAERGE